MYNNRVKDKLKLNIITKGPFRKQIIIPMSKINSNIIVSQANIYIFNINRLLKDIKSEVSANFIHFDNKYIIITTNKAIVVIAQGCGQTLGLGLVDRNRTVV